MSGPFKLKYDKSSFPFKNEPVFGPKVVKPITAEEAAKTGKKRTDLVVNAAKNWRKKLTTPKIQKMQIAEIIKSKEKEEKEEKIIVGPLSPGIVVPDE